MKILMLNHFPLEGSGSGIYALNVARELIQNGHEILFIGPGHIKPEIEGDFPSQSIIFNNKKNTFAELNFNFPCFTTHPDSDMTFYEMTESQIEDYIAVWRKHINQAIEQFQPDIIHAHHVWIIPYIVAGTGLPYVISCHGTDLMGYKEVLSFHPYVETAVKNTGAIFTISKQVNADAIRTYKSAKEKMHLIAPGFGENYFKLLPEVSKENFFNEFNIQGNGSEPMVSFAGKFTDFKGIDILLKAAAIYEELLPQVKTILVGDGKLWQEMSELRDSFNLQGVTFLGQQPQSVLARLYNAADVSAVPSRIEPFGLVAIEALACGTPVVATNAGGLPDFINEKVGALIPLNDPESLAKAIVSEIKGNTKKTKGVYANQYAYESYTWKQQVARMTDIYHQVIAKSTALRFTRGVFAKQYLTEKAEEKILKTFSSA